MKKEKKIGMLLVLVVIVLLGVVFYLKPKTEKNASVEAIDMAINPDNGDEAIDWSLYTNQSYTLTKSITITESGTYNLTGTIADGLIKIDTTGVVKLVLDNVTIENSKGPAIFVANAEDVVINLVDGSTNTLSDGTNYEGYASDEVGVIFSHDDLTFEGNGTLIIQANLEDGIVSKDDLKFVNGNYEITSLDDGIRGSDSVYIVDGEFTIKGSGDGIKSTNDTDSSKGFILIDDGTFKIDALSDGIESVSKCLISNGDFNITTGDGSQITSQDNNWGFWNQNIKTSDTPSAKGIKAQDNLVIENGTLVIDSADDAIHSNNYVGIKNGEITIKAGDDGIHADNELIIDDGIIKIQKSYEGLEAAKMTINNGQIEVNASDDGINVAGGNDSSALNRKGANNFTTATNNVLTINAGEIYVNSQGDGIDINGSGYINGGNITVDGPTDNGNGALDYDGSLVVNGGALIAGGSSGMVQSTSSNSQVYSVLLNFTSTLGIDDKVTITDENNETIITYESLKNFSSLLVVSPYFVKNKTYTVKINNQNWTTFTISSITTTVGETANMGGNGPRQPGGNQLRR